MNLSLKQNDGGSNNCSIQQQLWNLRHEDPTQYHTLVKMHLSFATDLPTDHCEGRANEQTSSRRWHLAPLIRKLGRVAVPNKGVMEGAPLTQEGVCQAFQLIHYLNKDYNISQEGLFRKSGSLSRQQELKALLNSGGDLNLDYGVYSAHDCASVLKSFLADLPEPLLTEGHYSIHCKVAEMLQSHMSTDQKDLAHSRQIKALRLLFLLLPPENYQLLHDLLMLLHRVAAHQKENLMSAINLGTMFAPHILCPRKMAPNDLQYLSGTLSTAVAFMIEQASQLFQIPLELEYDVRQYWSNKKNMRHQLSKRSMMEAPAKTIFTFIDRELTAQANDKDVTEIALAELYAYVQSLPDSAKKRRLIKQFNHASGSGTPQLNQSFIKKQEARGKRLGDSIKKVIMTPRSRCPIIINSATSLSNVAIPEENSHSHVFHNAERNESNASIVSMHTSPVIANPAAQLASPPRPVQPLADSTNISTILSDQRKNDSDDDVESENSKEKNPRTSYNCKKMESKLSRWGSSSLRRTLSSASSTGSLFGSFFRHLSTSSLAQLATRLTSSSSLQNSELEDENTNIENEFVAEEEEDDDDDMNESLSSVFKDYLLSRSILTENPVDLSSDCLDNEDIEAGEKKSTSPSGKMAGKKDKIDQNFGDSAYYSSQPPSKCTSRQCSKTSLGSFDSAVDLYSSTNLSESLLYCLDGKNPLCASRSGEGRECENCQTRIHTQDAVVQSQSSFWQEQHIPKHKHELELHSCSPDSRRQSLLKTKHGTPVPQREKELSDSTKNAREVLFETSF
ncbi:hypothetical protein OTU49_003506 [Cherax quadricarinatus]|uniref:Rho-GAP domain-containing protein n=1 Tax=Cherax quadricarinatus TaxID=27406 RepID=A0AAW0XHB8_CHEQU